MQCTECILHEEEMKQKILKSQSKGNVQQVKVVMTQSEDNQGQDMEEDKTGTQSKHTR